MRKCRVCLKLKSVSEFSWKVKSKNIKHTICKRCVKKQVRKHYIKSKAKYLIKAKTNNRIYIKRNIEFFDNYLKDKKCVDCGNNNPVVLDFDHVRGNKKYNVGFLKRQPVSLETLKNEIEKCEIRCSNCHRIKTLERNKIKRAHRELTYPGTASLLS